MAPAWQFLCLMSFTFLAGIQTSSPSSLQARERKEEKTEEKANIVGTVRRNRGQWTV